MAEVGTPFKIIYLIDNETYAVTVTFTKVDKNDI